MRSSSLEFRFVVATRAALALGIGATIPAAMFLTRGREKAGR
jgi:hypothetical protein